VAIAPTAPTGADGARELRAGRMLIDGEWVAAESGDTFAVHDPVTGGVVAHCSSSGAPRVDRAVCTARRVFENGPWSRLRPSEGGRLLRRLADLIDDTPHARHRQSPPLGWGREMGAQALELYMETKAVRLQI
jgi:hypothetical protein